MVAQPSTPATGGGAGATTFQPSNANETGSYDMTNFKNMSTIQFDEWAYNLNDTQTGCYNNGSLPLALASNDTCLPGFYCPNSSDEQPPQLCPPTWQCAVLRANHQTCSQQGYLEPLICPGGKYCPPGGKQEVFCPEGYYCPQGSFQPTKCDVGAHCPRNSSHQVLYVPLGVILVIDTTLVVLLLAGLAFSKWRKRNKPTYSTVSIDITPDDIELLRGISVSPSLRGSVSPLPSPSISPLATPSLSPAPLTPAFDPSARFKGPSARSRSASGASYFSDYAESDKFMDGLSQDPSMQRFLIYLSRAIQTKEVGLSFDFEELSVVTPQGQRILHGITGSMPRGSMWGVMGGSGAGKSTFLNALMRGKASSGVVKINGWTKDMKKYKKLIGYVPQDDIVLPELTVRENILHSARMRLPSPWKDKVIQEFVDSLISCLSLSHVQHSLVGDARKPVISGGQRKRVSIGIELAAAPMAIFLDEPTSGLDATSAASVMRLLKAISQLGVTVISIIHQPREDIWRGFDQLLLLAQGRQVYAGPTSEAVNYFSDIGYHFPLHSNPADIIIDCITGDGHQYMANIHKFDNQVESLIKFWTEKGQYGKTNKHLSVQVNSRLVHRLSAASFQSTVEQEHSLHETMKERGASWPAQVYYCCKRGLLQQVRNRTSFFFEIGVAGLAGVVIGLSAMSSKGHLFQGIYHAPFTMLSSAVDYKSAPQLGLLSAMAIGLAASAPGVWIFGEEKMVFFREASSGHSRSAYYVGKVISTIPRIALASLHYTVFISVLATPLMRLFDMYAANLVYFYTIYGLASMISMIVKREDGPLLAVLSSLVIGILGGVAPPLSKVKRWHMEWFWRLSPGVWFTEAYWNKMTTPVQHVYEVGLASESIGFTLGQFALDLSIIFVIGTVYRIIAYVLLILSRKSVSSLRVWVSTRIDSMHKVSQ